MSTTITVSEPRTWRESSSEAARPEPSDRELFEACRRGDSGARALLCERHARSLLQRVLRRCFRGDARRLPEAEDLCQQAWLRFFDRLAGSSGGLIDRMAYIERIAANLYLDRLRRLRPVEPPVELAMVEEPGAQAGGGPLEELIDLERIDGLRQRYWRAVRVLPEATRRCYVLFAIRGWGYARIRTELAAETTIEALQLRVSRARRSIARALAACPDVEESTSVQAVRAFETYYQGT